ncbi:acyl-CoA/acyl-ACP dehydrogenase [Pseudomonas gregormendelii]|uniref:Acyl-CoA/acyl-ACP dehydrogenase n=1 Tax=Pseudomonas gregormendelii TaxID=1628277 RepID=A0ABS3AR12_9PSED|nr:acyl-CoA dehydrogenase family protein [Pseudomonas gregormendelii]MBN3968611.1 acyl-CoA/acyl-ACP dehydrogenase [Pseudomonas gregormendelii]
MLDPTLSQWLDAQALDLDVGSGDSQKVLSWLAAADVLRVGVNQLEGGNGKTIADAVEVLAQIASCSLAAAFVFCGQRTFIEYLIKSPNKALREKLLPSLLDGKLAGATGLSNAMKFLSGIEALLVTASSTEKGWRVDGRLPWVTNLRRSGFVVAAAVEGTRDGRPFILAIPSTLSGLKRSDDLQLIGLQSTNTAALHFTQLDVNREWLIHDDARVFLPALRPAFLGLQCGLAIGLARRSLMEVEVRIRGNRSVLAETFHEQRRRLEHLVSDLKSGLLDGRFVAEPTALFCLRIAFSESATNAVNLELQASGGSAFLSGNSHGFARRLRESAFLPILTPSLVQLRTELQRQGGEAVVWRPAAASRVHG